MSYRIQNNQLLGHIVGKGNIKPDPVKTEKILNLTRPKTKKKMSEKFVA